MRSAVLITTAVLALAAPAGANPGAASQQAPAARAAAKGKAKAKPRARAKAKPSTPVTSAPARATSDKPAGPAALDARAAAKTAAAKTAARTPASRPGTVDLFTLRPNTVRSKQGVDLFPPELFDRGQLAPPSPSKSERRSGLALGDDGGWRVQSAQVGAMALGWVALSALCGGGKCLIPNSWVPGPLRAEPYTVPNPVLPQKQHHRGTDLGRNR